MTQDSIDSWLKAAADNKINQKNTWNAPLIDHFTKIEEFRDKKGINFQKVSNTLEGCMKVYVTRVDNINEETFKLLESLNYEETEQKSKKVKSKSNTLETNINNINLKNTSEKIFIEPDFFNFKENISLLRNTQISSKGVLILEEIDEEDGINLLTYPFEAPEFENKKICPTLNEINPEITTKLVEDEKEEMSFYDQIEFNDAPEPINVENIELTQFGYTKNFTGPSFWTLKKEKNKEKVLKEKYKIDFNTQIDLKIFKKKDNSTFSNSELLNRKKEFWLLPPLKKVKSLDLYKFNVKSGEFTNLSLKEPSFIDEISNFLPAPQVTTIENDAPDDVAVDFKNIKNVTLSKKLHLKFRRVPKRVDITLLQQKMSNCLENNKNISLKKLCTEVSNLYEEKERSEITPQYCVLSLLFLAQEKNFKLEKDCKNEVIVQF